MGGARAAVDRRCHYRSRWPACRFAGPADANIEGCTDGEGCVRRVPCAAWCAHVFRGDRTFMAEMIRRIATAFSAIVLMAHVSFAQTAEERGAAREVLTRRSEAIVTVIGTLKARMS